MIFMVAGSSGAAPGGGYQDETLSYQARVEADGGTIVSLADIDAAIIAAKAAGFYSDIKAWYSARFGYKDDGAGVTSKLYDLSPNNNDAIASTTRRPTWTANQQNGKAGIVFDGSTDGMSHSYTGTGNTTMIAVVQGAIGGSTGPQTIAAIGNAGVYRGMTAQRTDGGNWGTYMNSSKPSSYSVWSAWRILMQLDGGSTTEYLYTDNNSVETMTDTSRYSDGYDRRYVGMGYPTDGEYFKGIIGEFIAISKQISSEEITAMKAYLNGAWAIY